MRGGKILLTNNGEKRKKEKGKGDKISLKSNWQGRSMVYPEPIDPYFRAVILIPEPHFPQNFDP